MLYHSFCPINLVHKTKKQKKESKEALELGKRSGSKGLIKEIEKRNESRNQRKINTQERNGGQESYGWKRRGREEG